MKRRGPLAGSYPGAVAMVVLALVPFLLLTAAILPLGGAIAKGVGITPHQFDITVALADAGYAFGTVLAVQLAVHLPTRRLLLGYVTLFLVASVLSAWAPSGWVFMVALVVQGLCTSLMLIAAVPPLLTGWPTERMPYTAAVMNLCIFGAVAAGPSVGNLQAASGGWRPLFWTVAGLAVLALVFVVLTFEDDEAADRTAPWDLVALGLAGGGCAAAFFGAGTLEASRSVGATSVVPLLVGTAMIVGLVVHQYRAGHPLMPVKQIATTFPVTGLLIALFASSAAFALMDLVLTALRTATSPSEVALLFLPELAGAVATAAAFGAVFRTRYIPVLALSGMALLTGAAAVAAGMVTSGNSALAAVSSGLIGLGVGASVSPALFLAGFSLRSAQIQRVFALVELLRGVTAFLVAPVLLYVVTVIGVNKADGIRNGMWICMGLAAVGGLAALLVFVAGGERLQAPDLDRWQGEGEPAWESTPLLARLRGGGRPGAPVGTDGGPVAGASDGSGSADGEGSADGAGDLAGAGPSRVSS